MGAFEVGVGSTFCLNEQSWRCLLPSCHEVLLCKSSPILPGYFSVFIFYFFSCTQKEKVMLLVKAKKT